MKRRANFQWFMILALFASFLFSHPFVSYAETDVTSKVQLTKSTLLYDRLKGTSYFDLSIRNTSQDTLLVPIKVVIDSISPSSVTVANPDGVADAGKPFYDYSNLVASQKLDVSVTSSSRRLVFNNPLRQRFTYTLRVIADVDQIRQVQDTAGGFCNSLINNDPAAAQDLFAEEGKDKNLDAWQSLDSQFRQMLGQAMREGFQFPASVPENTTSLPIQIRLVDGNGQAHYGTMVLVKDPNGNWKIKKW